MWNKKAKGEDIEMNVFALLTYQQNDSKLSKQIENGTALKGCRYVLLVRT